MGVEHMSETEGFHGYVPIDPNTEDRAARTVDSRLSRGAKCLTRFYETAYHRKVGNAKTRVL